MLLMLLTIDMCFGFCTELNIADIAEIPKC